jgi:restriction system protein
VSLQSSIKGWLGEKMVAFGLWLGLNKRTYRRFDDVILRAPDGTTQIDHVVLSIYGIFVIETKNMQGWIFGDAYQDRWTQTIYKFKTQFQNPLRQNFRHTKCLADFLELDHDLFHPIIMFIGDCKLKTGVPPNVMTSGLIPYIRGFSTPLFTSEQVEDVAKKLVALRRGGRISKSDHLKSLEVRHSIPVCPKCGSELIQRTARKGARAGSQFLGCASYPKCAFTRPLSSTS